MGKLQARAWVPVRRRAPRGWRIVMPETMRVVYTEFSPSTCARHVCAADFLQTTQAKDNRIAGGKLISQISPDAAVPARASLMQRSPRFARNSS